MPTDPQEYLNRLVSALANAGPDSDAVKALLAEAGGASAAQRAAAEQFVQGWRRLLAPYAAPPAADPPAPAPTPPGSWARPAGMASLGAVLAGLAAAGYFKWDAVEPFLASLVQSPSMAGQLALVATAGAVGGLVNGWLAGNVTWMPQTRPVDGAATGQPRQVFFPGVVGNALTGAVGAVVAVWLPLWSHAADGSSGGLVATLGASLLVGLCGSQVLTSRRDWNLLLSVLPQAADNPSDPHLAEALGRARSPLHAAEMVLGRSLSAPAAAPASAEAGLRSLFDADALRQHFDALRAAGKPAVLTRDGDGLELGALKAVRDLGDRVPGGVRHFRLADAARLDRAAFRKAVAAAAPAAAGTMPVEAVWDAAQDAAAALARMPAGWQATPEMLLT